MTKKQTYIANRIARHRHMQKDDSVYEPGSNPNEYEEALGFQVLERLIEEFSYEVFLLGDILDAVNNYMVVDEENVELVLCNLIEDGLIELSDEQDEYRVTEDGHQFVTER